MPGAVMDGSRLVLTGAAEVDGSTDATWLSYRIPALIVIRFRLIVSPT